jgi:hypothetical protein
VAPKTRWGRLLTIVYALVGIPLTFLYLSNIGNFLADCFRLFYKRVCCDVLCCEKCDRKRKRLRLKLRRRREMMAAAAEQYNVRFEDEDVDDWESPDGGLADKKLAFSDKCEGHRIAADYNANPLVQLQPASDSEAGASSSRASSSNRFRLNGSDRHSSSSWSTTSSTADDDDGPAVIELTRETAILDDDVDEDGTELGPREEVDFNEIRETAIIESSPASDRRANSHHQRRSHADDHGKKGKQAVKGAQAETASDEDAPSEKEPTPRRHRQQLLRSFETLHCSADDITTLGRTERKQLARITFGGTTTSDDPPNSSKLKGGAGLRRCASEKRHGYQRRTPLGVRIPHADAATDDVRRRHPSPGALFAPGSKLDYRALPQSSAAALANWIHLRELLVRRQEELKANGAPAGLRTSASGPVHSTSQSASPSLPSTALLTLPPRSQWENCSSSSIPSRQSSSADRSVPSGGHTATTTTPASVNADHGNPFRRIVANLKRVTSRRGTGGGRSHGAAAAIGDARDGPNSSASTTETSASGARSGSRSRPRSRSRTAGRGSEESFVTANSDDDDEDDDGDGDEAGTRSRASSIGPDGSDERPSRLKIDNAVGATITDTTVLTLDTSDVSIPPPSATLAAMFPQRSGGSSTFRMISSSGFDPFAYELDGESSTSSSDDAKVTVPVSICLIIIAGYIFAGAVLFTLWEDWDLLTGSYFCFITLSTIGFGDIVPGTDMDKWASHEKLVLCALWLAFGLSLLAMCFNLMQEEVKEKCKWIGRKLGLLKDEGDAQ